MMSHHHPWGQTHFITQFVTKLLYVWKLLKSSTNCINICFFFCKTTIKLLLNIGINYSMKNLYTVVKIRGEFYTGFNSVEKFLAKILKFDLKNLKDRLAKNWLRLLWIFSKNPSKIINGLLWLIETLFFHRLLPSKNCDSGKLT